MRNANVALTILVVTVAMAIAIPSPASATARYDDANATVPVNNGSSWCGAFLNLQDALGAAVATDEIRVGDGTYFPEQGRGETPGHCSAKFPLVGDLAP